MQTRISQSDREFLESLNRQGTSTISEICEREGVTTNAVRQRLTRLLATNHVDRETIRAGRGRPQHKYRVSEDGKKLLGNNYSELAAILWKQLQKISDDNVRQSVIHQLKDTLIERYGGPSENGDTKVRFEQLRETLREHGYDIDLDQDDAGLSLTECSCPYHDLAVEDRSICELEQDVFESILGVQLELTQRCVDGNDCCRFEQVHAITDNTASAKTESH